MTRLFLHRLVVLLLSLSTSVVTQATPCDTTRRHPVAISAHRGSHNEAPENTLAAYRLALNQGAHFIEFDVRTTLDSQLVIMHDGQLDRTTTGTGPVQEKTLAQLRQLTAGKRFTGALASEPIPTLDDVCRLVSGWNAAHPTPARLYVDCKAVAPMALLRVLRAHGLLDQCVFYGSDSFLLALKNAEPTTRRMPSLNRPDEVSTKIERLQPYAFDVRWSILEPALINTLHQRGIRVFSDALGNYESKEEYQRAARMGIDLIQTDYVLRVREALDELNRP